MSINWKENVRAELVWEAYYTGRTAHLFVDVQLTLTGRQFFM